MRVGEHDHWLSYPGYSEMKFGGSVMFERGTTCSY